MGVAEKRRRRRSYSGGAMAVGLIAMTLAGGVPPSQAAGPPIVGDVWASSIFSSTARLNAQVNPNGLFTTYHFDYISRAAYEANVAASKDPFTGTLRIPAASEANIGSGTSAVTVSQVLSNLTPDTAYRYRIVAKNSTTTTGPTQDFATRSIGGGPVLPDDRGWEMVSPIDKNGGDVNRPESLYGGGVLQAAADGESVTYSSAASFAGGQGAPPASQYLAHRASGGWSTANLTQPIFSGTYDAEDQGVPYQLFSTDLARGLLLNGDHCRGEGEDCAVANPPLAGTTAPAGYQNYYLREGGTFAALLGSANAGFLALGPSDFDLRLAGATADLRRAVVSTCAALTANAVEVPVGSGCDEAKQNLYVYSAGGALSLINILPSQTTGTPGASLAAQSGAISADGSRVYFELEGNLYLRTSGQTQQVDDDAAGGGQFETVSGDGTVAFFTKGGHLWRYVAGSGAATDLTPSGGVTGVLGASASGSVVYFQDSSGLRRWSSGSTTTVAPGVEAALESNWPPTTGTARVSEDGSKLLFVSEQPLTGFDNTDLRTGQPDSQVFFYDAAGGGNLICVSCNPTFGRPVGPSTIPGSFANGSAGGSTDSYKPRVLSANGRRVFFESADALGLSDTNNSTDVYQWEAQGEGGCNRKGGCVDLISDGRTAGAATFVDASSDGAEVFFLTVGSLVKSDLGARDLYVARIAGGFPEPPPPIKCEADACQPLPSAPVDPTLTTLLAGPGNPAVRYPKTRCRKGKVKRKGRCVRRAGKEKRRSARNGGKRR